MARWEINERLTFTPCDSFIGWTHSDNVDARAYLKSASDNPQ